MKTKYLIAMLAAPLFFTGCSQDEFVESVSGTETIEGVAYGDDLTFNVGDKVDASTRVTTNGKWSEGDRIGMAWVSDQYNVGGTMKTADNETPIAVFTDAEKVLGNTPLDFTSGTSFKSSTMMFVGTYVAYYPFNEEVKSVSKLKLSVGANQESGDLEDAYNKMIFASDTLSLQAENAGTGKTPKINMKRLSNMLALDIRLKAASTTMTAPVIQKVEMDLKDNNATPAPLLAVSGTVVPKNWDKDKTNEPEKKYFKSLSGTADKYYLTPEDKGMISVTTKEDLAVSTTQDATVYLSFMPSDLENLTDANCVLKIYTNYGVISYKPEASEKGIALYNWDSTNKKYEETVKTVQEAFEDADKVAGRLIKKRAVIDLTKVSVDGLTATNAAEIRKIVDNWKLQGDDATGITINVKHPAVYQEKFNENEGSGKTCKNIELAGLDLSDIPDNLIINAVDTLEFTGATNLNKVGKTITIREDETTKQSVVFKGTTTIGSLIVNGAIAFEENTTVKGTLEQTPVATTDIITVAAGKTLTVDAGVLKSNMASNSKLVNSGTISLINSGSINKDVTETNLTIQNWTVKSTTPTTTYNEGVINIGNGESQGYLEGVTATGFDNEHGTVRYFNGDYETPGEGTIIAVAQNALQFSAAVEKNVTTIEITGEIKFSAFDLDVTKGKATKVIMKSGSKLNLDAKTVTLGSVEVAENATIEGAKLIVFKTASGQDGHLAVKANATLTVGDNTEINANVLDLPTASKIEGDEKTSKVVYKAAGLVGGTYTASVAQNSSLTGVE